MSHYLTIARSGHAEFEAKRSRFLCTLERSSGDGEPAGTAGAPMLDVLRSRGVAVLDASYSTRVRLRVGVAPDGEERLHAIVAELTSGTATAVAAGERWVDVNLR